MASDGRALSRLLQPGASTDLSLSFRLSSLPSPAGTGAGAANGGLWCAVLAARGGHNWPGMERVATRRLIDAALSLDAADRALVNLMG